MRKFVSILTLAAPWTTPAAAIVSIVTFLGLSASTAASPTTKETDVNGVRLTYVEQGLGEPVVFVHGAVGDLRAWESLREEIAQKHRFIAYTQRYFGTNPWPDDGRGFSVATHADDLATFIAALNAGPVHIVGWSYGGTVAINAAIKDPSLVRSLVLYEPSVSSVLAPDSPEAKQAAVDRGRIFGPAVVASKAGDPGHATQLMIEGVFQLPPGGFAQQAPEWQRMFRDNARTLPLTFAAPPPPSTPCDTLKTIKKPTLIVSGAQTSGFFPIIDEALAKCISGVQRLTLPNVNHDGPARDPKAFSKAILEFLSKQAGSRG